ncbi:MAG: tRNA (adenosine(37)-N6)-threonylcarbamoyltransferase complex transferase subunit TsaD [Alphaproteobacteria bacterium CG_4_10_14_0_2_um_filter_63_37]|nr:MAG: tRNA (adenosine(37)-N6)-threonylcarbamoyltransferase complex transferase subunit TsaD [Alphaproteobacteria bacterium CG_4_10_14_0_2_um_filter_63_37]
MILGIETSCDDTGVALLDTSSGQIVFEAVRSQNELHAPFLGVVPEIASRGHIVALPELLAQGLAAIPAGRDLKAVAVTAGPGLIGALLVGVASAKGLAHARRVPLIAVHHIEGHIAACFMECPWPEHPVICLLVSGGHTQLWLVEGPGHMKLLGQTLDDAAGEAFDKGATLLGLPYPGGPALAALADQGDAKAVAMPRPWLKDRPFDFSFSGLKTALRTKVLRENPEGAAKADMAAAYQESIVQVLVGKAVAATEQTGAKGIVIAGGVSANRRLRELLDERCRRQGLSVFLPPFNRTTDNGAMIAYAGWLRLQRGMIAPETLSADPRWAMQPWGEAGAVAP